MTPEILLVLGVLAGAGVLFVTGWVRLDLTALLVLLLLVVTGILTPTEALAGFSSSAVIIVSGMFVLSAGLARTGVAGFLGRRLFRLGGSSERRLLAVIMLAGGGLSAFMNNAGVAAMMLPVIMDMARRARIPPGRLLLPLVLAVHLGGLTTLLGTPPNVVASEALEMQGLAPFGIFTFAPMGVVLLGVGVAFLVLAGPSLLPARDPRRVPEATPEERLAKRYALEERLFRLRLPSRSLLDGMTLDESRLGSALGLHVLAIRRGGRMLPAPGPATALRAGDELLAQGRADLLLELRGGRHLALEDAHDLGEELTTPEIGLAEARVPEDSPLVGQTLNQTALRTRTGTVVLALRRSADLRRSALEDLPLEAGDALLLQGPHERLDALLGFPELAHLRRLEADEALGAYDLEDRLLSVRVTPASLLAGRTLQELHLGDAAGLTVLGIERGGVPDLVPAPDTVLEAGDLLLVKVHPQSLKVLRGLRKLEVEEADAGALEALPSDKVGLLEVVLSPRTKLVGLTPRQIGFRDRYGLTVLALWRGDQGFRTNLRDRPLQFGDSLLLFGPLKRLELLAREPDFLVLSAGYQEPPRKERAPVAVGLLGVVVFPVLLGWISLPIAVLLAATLMVLTRCVTPEEAYRAVEWPAVILVAGMLSLGLAMERTGAALFLAEGVLSLTGDQGPRAVLAGLCLMTALGAQFMPPVALVAIMAPVALTAAGTLGIAPQTLMMGVALSSACLASPVSHPANVLVMGPGGYRYADYLRIGIPLTVVSLVLIVAFLPLFIPF